jgi:hypothetical protein
VPRQLLLGQRWLEVELTTEPDTGGNIGEEVFHRRHPDRREHLLAVALGQREVAQLSATT